MIKTKEFKNDKGITMISLIVTIVLMFIFASTTIYTSYDRFEINTYNKMINDIELLVEKVANYYLKYDNLPILRDENNEKIEYTYTTLNFAEGTYYIIDLKAMEGITLNYGQKGFETPNESDNVYVINSTTHQIYFVKGVEMKGERYYTVLNNNGIENTVPPSSPQIKIVSGTLNNNGDGTYITEVELEIIPGKSMGEEAYKTDYSIDGGNTWEDISTLTNNIYKITGDGTHNIKVRSYDEKGRISECEIQIKTAILRIGDKVAYDEGTGKTSSVDSAFEMKKLEWRVLDIEDDGKIELISTQPTESTFRIEQTEEGYLNSVNTIDRLCNDLYGKGTGAVRARNLKIEDINKLANYDPTTINGYGQTTYYFKYDTEEKVIQSMDYNELTEEGTWNNTTKSRFKEPGKTVIDSENYYYSLAANGTTTIGTRMAKIQPNYIWYNIEEQISSTLKTRDGRDEILISELISQGLNNTNTSASGTYQEQWLSSSYIKIADKNDYVEYGLFYTDGEGDVEGAKLYNSYETGGNIVVGYKLRPVVVLDTNNIKLTLVNNKWEIAKLEQ